MTLRSEDINRLHRTVFNMTNHPPTLERAERIEQLRELFKQLAAAVYVNCEEGRERAVALTKLEEAQMWAVASVARESWGEEEE